MSGRVPWTFRPVGAEALLVEVGDGAAAQAAYQLVRSLTCSSSGLRPPRDVVPGARTVLLDGLEDVRGWRELLRESQELASADGFVPQYREVTVTVRYDGPDLDLVAAAWSCSTRDVVRRHVGATYTVAFCGFAAGFAYCTSDPPQPVVPRREHPRSQVPAGSLGLAGEYCGIYPRTLPGGWQLIGSTEAVVFDAQRRPPALLHPGDRVRFEES